MSIGSSCRVVQTDGSSSVVHTDGSSCVVHTNSCNNQRLAISLLSLKIVVIISFSSCSGHILDDKDLIQTLEKSKTMAAEIKERIHQSEITERKLNIARKRYSPVSGHSLSIVLVLQLVLAVQSVVSKHCFINNVGHTSVQVCQTGTLKIHSYRRYRAHVRS